MKNAFSKIGKWLKGHLPTKRRLIQIYAALLFNANVKGYISGRIYTGKTKYACVPGMNCYSCPGAVGSCPLGSLQNALAASGNTAPYYVIGILALFGLILGRTICGYLCPVGLGQELLYKLHTPKLKKSKFTRVLSYLKYVLLVGFVIIIPILYGQQGIAVPAFCKYVCPAGTFGGGLGLLLNPNNQDYLAMLGPIFTWKFCLLMVIMAACVFCYRSFCRFLCPLGAIYGFFNRFALIGVHVDRDNCTDCGLCVSHCKMDVRRVGDHECINCGECVSVCPTKAISWKGGKLFLRRNEVDGSLEQPVPTLPSKSDCSAENISQAAPKLSTTIDGHAGLFPTPVNAMALEIAGIPAPMLAPDAGLPSAGDLSSKDAAPTTLSATSAPDGEADAKPQASPSEAQKGTQKNAENKNKKPSFSQRLKAASRTPKFWTQCVAVVLALALLIGAFVYFGLQEEEVAVKIKIGAPCPDFSLRMYEKTADGYVYSQNKFTLSEHKGEVVIVNFWGTWCGPCVKELPDFELLKENYPEVTVLAIHGDPIDAPVTSDPNVFVSDFIKQMGWQYITFAQDIVEDSSCRTFKLLGGKDSWPMTLILDKEGNVSFIRHGSLGYSTLEAETIKLL